MNRIIFRSNLTCVSPYNITAAGTHPQISTVLKLPKGGMERVIEMAQTQVSNNTTCNI